MHPDFSDSKNKSLLSASPVFISISAGVFMIAVLATVYYTRSMSDEMVMPGGWRMSMMWMRMPGETWLSSATGFLLMWLAMMIAMMMPSALPVFLKTKQQWQLMCYTASGYFAVWLVAGSIIYFLGILINNAAMRSAFLSTIMPLISGVALVVAAVIQFTPWKMTRLMRCRTVTSCSIMPNTADGTGFTLGCKQGIACCTCCAALMSIQLILGIMNPLVMAAVAIVITAEKLVTKPKIVACLAGIAAFITGVIIILRWMIE